MSLFLSGCPGGAELDNAEQLVDRNSQLELAPGEYCDALPIFADTCGTTVCHGADEGLGISGAVDLVSPGVAERLLDVAPSYPWNPECASTPRLLIDSAAPEQSYLLQKVERSADCGFDMPITESLSQQDTNCVRSWIEGVISGDPGVTQSGAGGSPG